MVILKPITEVIKMNNEVGYSKVNTEVNRGTVAFIGFFVTIESYGLYPFRNLRNYDSN